jgi:surfeit locus 1 family protein
LTRSPTARGRSHLALGACLACALFLALGTWQLQRRTWKLDLIARVEARVHAPAVPFPAWHLQNPSESHDAEYLRVRLEGRYLPGRNTLVQANTRLGPGFWVLTPLRSADGATVLVNRGFVPAEMRTRFQSETVVEDEAVTVTGLLRLSEPGGALLRDNRPDEDRWYSRDVPAIARARGLDRVAPWFVDAQPGTPGAAAPDWPRAGLTVIAFPNNHLVYALTWYALALLCAWACWQVLRAPAENAASPAGSAGPNGHA